MAIHVENLSKRYWLRGRAPATFQQSLGRLLGVFQNREPFWALKDVGFHIKPGEQVGLVGTNGAGKSTLLRLICGLGKPTSGRAVISGRIAALLELGVGFHPYLSGRENLLVSAVVSGLSRSEAVRRYGEIVQFAEIDQFIDQPLRTYSSGMQMRLAFSVAIHVDPDILVVDESLSVGDTHFQAKCLDRIDHFKKAGRTLLIVSHDMSLVRKFTSRTIWLEQGVILADGPSELVASSYENGDLDILGGYGKINGRQHLESNNVLRGTESI
jgi:lipopolysaccharide transport system ATP-binding protein